MGETEWPPTPLDKAAASTPSRFSLFLPSLFSFPPLCLFLCRTTNLCRWSLMSLHFLSSVMRRNPFGVDICCRKGSRSPLQELYNPTQVSPSKHPPCLHASVVCVCVGGGGVCRGWEMNNYKLLFFGNLKLPRTAWHFPFSGSFLGPSFSM